MRSWKIVLFVAALVILLDFYIFQVIRSISQGASSRAKMTIFTLYWGISICAVIFFAISPFLHSPEWPRIRNYVFATVLGLFFAKLLAAVFFLLDDIRRLIQWAVGRLFFHNTEGSTISGDRISRSTFLTWLGIGIGGTLFSSLLYGF